MSKTHPTRTQRAALAEQRTASGILREWREACVARAERKRAKAARKRRKAGLTAAQQRIPERIAQAPAARVEVICQGGRAGSDKDRRLSGRRRIRARKAARRSGDV